MNRGDRVGRRSSHLTDHQLGSVASFWAEHEPVSARRFMPTGVDAQSFSSGRRDRWRNLVAGMKWLLGTYTGRFNRRHKLFGHLFSGRYKSLIVDGSGNGYLKTVCDYVHLNPVPGFCCSGWEHGLGRFFLGAVILRIYLRSPRTADLAEGGGRLLGEHGIPRDRQTGRCEFGRVDGKRRRRTEAEAGKEFEAQRAGMVPGRARHFARNYRPNEGNKWARASLRGGSTYGDGAERGGSRGDRASGFATVGVGPSRFWRHVPKAIKRKRSWRCGCGLKTTMTVKWIARAAPNEDLTGAEPPALIGMPPQKMKMTGVNTIILGTDPGYRRRKPALWCI